MCSDQRYRTYVAILHEELLPAMGCTEPISIALAAATAREALHELPARIEIYVSNNIIKNVKSVVVPNTGGQKGIAAAVAIGTVAGEAQRMLEVISNVTNQNIVEMQRFLRSADIEVHPAQDGDVFDISRNIDIDTRTAAIIKDADILLERCQDKYSHVKEHQLLLRCLDEQTAIDNGGRRLRIKGEESPKPTSLQNPTDPEATFSAKAGKKHIGYVANIVETVSNGGSVIVDYQYEQNIYSDSRFLGNHLDQLPPQEAPAYILMYGAYSGQMHRDAAAEKNVKLINTSLKGTPVPDIYADFEISEDGEQILRCPAGHKPTRCKYISTSNQVKAYFPNESCSQCPHLEHCHPKLRKCSSLIVLSRSAIGRANQQRLIAAEDFRNWRRIRNGVEAIPAILRNCYHVDEMPVRGKIPGKFFFGAKISAVNFKKLLRQRRGFCCHSQNPLLT